MRKIDLIVIHCSATKAGQDYGVNDIRKWHRKRGYRDVGYHYVIKLDGTIQLGRPETQAGAHVAGHNARSIGVCYIGGLSVNGKATDTRTQAQKDALHELVAHLLTKYPKARVVGHRDLSPDKNDDGVIQKWEWLKECPCFDVTKEKW